jgi:DeoR family transcriptional regulator, fructose operon transcriptional repressor
VTQVLPSERRKAIVAAVTAGVRTDELAEQFGVSGETVRRDLIRLERDGLLNRVYGGAEPADRPRASEAAFGSRQTMNLKAKQQIARLAGAIVRPGQIVMIDIGTTAVELARNLPKDWTGTVVTNSLLVAAELADRDRVDVTVLGGRIRAGDLAASGPQTLAALAELYADVAFLSSGGLDSRAGLTDYYADEVDVRRLMISHARHTYLLADSTKFDVIAARVVAPFSAIGALFTERAPEGPLADALADSDVQVLLPPALRIAASAE